MSAAGIAKTVRALVNRWYGRIITVCCGPDKQKLLAKRAFPCYNDRWRSLITNKKDGKNENIIQTLQP